MNQTRMLHNTKCHACPIFAATTHIRGTGITYVRLPSESKTSGGSVVRALSRRYRCLCDSAARSQRMSLSLSLSTCTCHAGMVHSHLHGMHLHIQSLTLVHMSQKTSHGKRGMRLPQMLHSKLQSVHVPVSVYMHVACWHGTFPMCARSIRSAQVLVKKMNIQG